MLGANTYKEIYLQPESFEEVLKNLPEVYDVLKNITPYETVIFTGCGSSYYLAQCASHIFATLTNKHSIAVTCSELYFFPKRYIGDKNTLVVPITRKSYTTEVRMAMDCVRKLPNVKTLSITCDPDSQLYNDYMILSKNAKEESVVMTRTYTSMLYIAIIMSLRISGKKDEIDALKNIPEIAKAVIPKIDNFAKTIIEENSNINLYVNLGQGEFFGVAAESMNKIKEMAIANTEAYHSLEYRHGPLSIADGNTLILLFAKRDCEEYEVKLLAQLKTLGAKVAVIGENVDAFDAHYKLSLKLGFDDMYIAPLLSIAGQLLGYHAAVHKDLDADRPRNVAHAIVL